MFEIAIDTGGTFTDAVLADEKQKITISKVETIPSDPARGIMNSIADVAEKRKMTLSELLGKTATITIGTTLATNAILEEKGAKCCLLYTKGFKDTFELGRTMPKTDIYNLKVEPPKVLIPRYLRFGVEERMQFDGKVITPLNEKDVLQAVEKAKKNKIEVPVICFLHSYINPDHEEQAGEIVKKAYPNVVISSRILRRWIEYDRLSTATFAAYVKPILTRFVENLKKSLGEANFKGTMLFTTSLGDVTIADVAIENPSLIMGSGVADGALMGRFLAEQCKFNDVLTFDMGGTSTDIAVLKDRIIATTTETIVGDQKNAIESMDIASIGEGGGSIAWIDRSGIIRVGPESGAAAPGPACYGRGGKRPTTTDADVVLGYIPVDYFLGGVIPLHADLAEKVISENIAKPLKIDTVEAAYSIASLAEAAMGEKVFISIVEKGYDPRDFVITAAGGAGPVHGVAMAKKLGMKKVYVPRVASVFSAFGGIVADYGCVVNRFYYRRDDQAKLQDIKAHYDSMEVEVIELFARQGISKKDMAIVRGAEMRYFGQLRDINVTLPEVSIGTLFNAASLKDLVAAFHSRHKELYGWGDSSLPATIAILKLRAIARRKPFNLIKLPLSTKDPSSALKRKRKAYFKELGGFVETPCYDGEKLKPANFIAGPAIVEEKDTTVVIPPGAELEVDVFGNYLITIL